MTNSSKNLAELSFENLAKLCHIELKQGWKKALTDKLGLGTNVIYNCIKRNSIPRHITELIEEEGYPRQKWLIPDAEPWHARKGRIAEKGIPHREVAAMYERLRALLKDLGIGIDTAIVKAGIRIRKGDRYHFLGTPPNPRELQRLCDKLGLDKEYVWSGIPSPEPNGQTDPESLKARAFSMLHEILDSGNQSLINAIIANLEAFSGAVRNEQKARAEIDGLRQECEEMKRRIEALERSRAGGRGTPEPESNAA